MAAHPENQIRFEVYDDEGVAVEHVLPGKYEVCSRCEGRGTTVNPSVDGNGLSREDFDQDPDFEEAYFRGDYDVDCPDCKGKRVELVVDEARADKDLTQKYWDQRREAAAERRADAYTRRMENGGRD